MKWDSDYVAKYTYGAVPGSIQLVDADMVEVITSLTKLGSVGHTQKGKFPVGVVFSSKDERDIYDVLKNQGWANNRQPKDLSSGDTIWVIPNKTIRKDNPNAIGVKFTLA